MKLTFSIFFLFGLITASVISSCSRETDETKNGNSDSSQEFTAKDLAYLFEWDDWEAPDTSSIARDKQGDRIRYGRDLIANTAYYLGPHGKVSRQSNGMNCQNCHLDAGTKLFANSFSAVYSNYPKLRARSGEVEDLTKRINDCMERSMNGKPFTKNSPELKAMIEYINWVGKDVEKDKTPTGASTAKLPYLDRAADPLKGELAYAKHCVSCHGTDGLGKLNTDSSTYQYPPLWGPHSYNTAAGLYRISRFAEYIKSNMPFLLSSFSNPTLTDEEAWDIAAFVNSRPRPEKHFPNDWPDISKKPVDHPFGPFSDVFSEPRHKFGPFPEIEASHKKKP